MTVESKRGSEGDRTELYEGTGDLQTAEGVEAVGARMQTRLVLEPNCNWVLMCL